MKKAQSIEDFYLSKFDWIPENLKKEIGHFNVFNFADRDDLNSRPIPFSKKNYYKISLLKGKCIINYEDKTFQADKNTLFFASPQIHYNWEKLTDKQAGFFCIFTEEFFYGSVNLKKFPIFSPAASPVFRLTEDDVENITVIFKKMQNTISSDYVYKYDLLRNLVIELLHYGLQMKPIETFHNQSNGFARIAARFLELLEHQFPIENSFQAIPFRKANEFANQLSVHVNHLNKALKQTTQKTTSEVISERFLHEAKILLKKSDWNISEIAYSLGFKEPAHFNNFFKMQVNQSPSQFRKSSK